MSELSKWLKPSNIEQHRWAADYLFRKNVSHNPNPPDPHYYLITLDNSASHDPAYILAVRSMKAAWRQKKLRKTRNGKTEFSLTISNGKKKKLNNLAKKKGKTLGETLEELIDDEAQRNEELRSEIKRQKELSSQSLELARGAHKTRIYEIEMYTNILLCLLEENLNKMIQYEMDAFKANHSSIHEHIGTKEFKEERFLSESETINKALKKVQSWAPKTFPLDIVTKLNTKQLIHNGK
ncbi:hypothetical protein [Billgrantia bachuensis]|uniref:Uncharacterized protein n=1 Tax=Billgrantia bachuensis TaxID=2717286 RepID=A0ABX0PPZ0_9GAMM|nr:hypothetical protein [Halomonas bachuensis]NIC05361.1 hypothetical protein [Halomonas bachuensis]